MHWSCACAAGGAAPPWSCSWRCRCRAGPAAPDGIVLAPHRAIYEMTLADHARRLRRDGGRAGRMVYDLTGSACEGYTQNMRFVTQMTNQSGTAVVTDLRSSSWEEGSGKRFRFNSSQFRDEKPTETTAGDAARANAADDVKVELTKPAKKDLSLCRARLFPDPALDRAAGGRQGRQGDRSAPTSTTARRRARRSTTRSPSSAACRPAGSNHKLPQVKNAERLDGIAAWPVSIGYFEPGSDKQRRGAGLRADVPVLRERRQPQAVHRLRRVRHAGRAEGDHLPPAEQVRHEVATWVVIPQVAWRSSGTQTDARGICRPGSRLG